MKVPANAKMGDVIHTIEVPAKFAKHRDHYIRVRQEGASWKAPRKLLMLTGVTAHPNVRNQRVE